MPKAQEAQEIKSIRKPADSEIAAIAKIGKLVEGLEGPARSRVVGYLHARYCMNGVGPATNNGV